MQQLIIIGANGHGKVVADIAAHCGYDKIVFLDDNPNKTINGNYEIIGDSSRISEFSQVDIIVAIGNSRIREDKLRYCMQMGCNIPILIHPDAIVSGDVQIGKGTVVMAGVVINSGTVIGKGCIVNTCSSIDHDCTLGDYIHVSVGSHLCGTVVVGNNTWIGAGSIISNNVNICGGCTIGAGAVVIKNIKEVGTYIGVPAQIMKKKIFGGGIAPLG